MVILVSYLITRDNNCQPTFLSADFNVLTYEKYFLCLIFDDDCDV